MFRLNNEVLWEQNTAIPQGADNMPGTLWMFHTDLLCRESRLGGYHAVLEEVSLQSFLKCVSVIKYGSFGCGHSGGFEDYSAVLVGSKSACFITHCYFKRSMINLFLTQGKISVVALRCFDEKRHFFPICISF